VAFVCSGALALQRTTVTLITDHTFTLYYDHSIQIGLTAMVQNDKPVASMLEGQRLQQRAAGGCSVAMLLCCFCCCCSYSSAAVAVLQRTADKTAVDSLNKQTCRVFSIYNHTCRKAWRAEMGGPMHAIAIGGTRQQRCCQARCAGTAAAHAGWELQWAPCFEDASKHQAESPGPLMQGCAFKQNGPAVICSSAAF
jgi:hypothetical protein